MTSPRAATSTADRPPRCDITVMGIRAEESIWFSTTFFGSSAALGKVRPEIWEKKTRVDTGRTLAEHLRACGGDPDRLRSGEPYLNQAQIAAFLEVHIEQGPRARSREASRWDRHRD